MSSAEAYLRRPTDVSTWTERTLGVTLVAMPQLTPSGRIKARQGRPRVVAKVMVPVKMTEAQRQRFKVACAEEGLSYADLVDMLLDQRAERIRRARYKQAHPLHQPERKSAYPGGGI